MLKHLHLRHVGPADALDLNLAPRLNLLTGDNGLGKSFLLDIAWWAMTRRWPAEINPNLVSGQCALPTGNEAATIDFSFTSKSKTETYTSEYRPRDQAWTGRPGRPANPGLVFYAMSDGSFAVWDPARNYWRVQGDTDVQDRIPAYVFDPSEVWDGLKDKDGKPLSLGLVMDWAGWQKEKNAAFSALKKVLALLSPSKTEMLTPGPLTRISLDDPRDIPTIQMPYGQNVPVLLASAGIRRILALAYVLVWAWEEHRKAAKLLNETPTRQMVLLIDEVESHLHPQWQRTIIPALLAVAQTLMQKSNAELQLVVATHSPLIMTSVEPSFDEKQDVWFDLDLIPGKRGHDHRVQLTQRTFERLGSTSSWLVSEAFDLPSDRSREAEELIDKAVKLADSPKATAAQGIKMSQELEGVLGELDPFWLRWRFMGTRRGWWDAPKPVATPPDLRDKEERDAQ